MTLRDAACSVDVDGVGFASEREVVVGTAGSAMTASGSHDVMAEGEERELHGTERRYEREVDKLEERAETLRNQADNGDAAG